MSVNSNILSGVVASTGYNLSGGDRLYSNEKFPTGASGLKNAIYKDETEAPYDAVRLWIGTKTTSGTLATYQAFVASTEEGRVDTVAHQFAPTSGGVVHDSVVTSGPGFRQVTWNGQPSITPSLVTGQGTGQNLAGYVASDWIPLASLPRTDVIGGRPMCISRVSQTVVGAAFPSGSGGSQVNWHLGRGQSWYREHCANVASTTATNSYPGSVSADFGDPMYSWLEFHFTVPARHFLVVGDSREASASSLFDSNSWWRMGLKAASTQAKPIVATNISGSGHSEIQFLAIANNILDQGWRGTDVLCPGFSQNGFNQGDLGASYIASINTFVNRCLNLGMRVYISTDYGINFTTGQTSETGRQNCIQNAKNLAINNPGRVILVDTDALITDYTVAAPKIKDAFNTTGAAGVEGAPLSGDGIHAGPTAQVAMASILTALVVSTNFALTSDMFIASNSFEKALPQEPKRIQGVIKNDSLGPIFVSENNDLNYQKNRPPGNGATATVTVPAGQEYVTDTTRMVYVKSYGGTSTAATFAAGVVTVTMTAHGFVQNQPITISGAVPVEYNSSVFPSFVTVASVIDANTFTYVPQLTPVGAASTQPAIQAISTVRVERKIAL